MEKSKLGISVCLLGAFMFLTGYLGVTVMVLVAGYILLKEENMSLKKAAVGTIVMYLMFVALSLCIGVLDNVFDVFNFGGWMYGTGVYTVFNDFLSLLNSIVYLAEKVVFGLFALFALLGKEIKIPFVDKFVEKHL
ncbi:MAG: hypothetical protein PUC30_05865 [Lachnospiraceae bacterium]|nr:hypothetical protein [Lachnospiraceae bacterium]